MYSATQQFVCSSESIGLGPKTLQSSSLLSHLNPLVHVDDLCNSAASFSPESTGSCRWTLQSSSLPARRPALCSGATGEDRNCHSVTSTLLAHCRRRCASFQWSLAAPVEPFIPVNTCCTWWAIHTSDHLLHLLSHSYQWSPFGFT